MHQFAQNKPHSLNIHELQAFSASIQQQGDSVESTKRRILTARIFITEELLTRIANMIQESKDLPTEFCSNDHFKALDTQYRESFDDLAQSLTAKEFTLASFNDMLQRILDRHSAVVTQMAFAVQQYKQDCLSARKPYKEHAVTSYLDRFFMARIGIRFLITHHLNTSHEIFEESEQLKSPTGGTDFGRVEKASLAEIVEIAYENAKSVCENLYMDAPELELDGMANLETTYPQAHLDYIFFEILKNAMKATMERYENPKFNLDSIPPVKVVLREGPHDVTIKVSDQAGGATTDVLQKWFDYQYSTSPAPVHGDSNSVVMAGFGMGLPLSRLYARYFSGDLRIQTQDGVGTDVFIYLKNKNLEKREVLPNYSPNLQKRNFQNSLDFRKDWTGSNATKRELSNY